MHDTTRITPVRHGGQRLNNSTGTKRARHGDLIRVQFEHPDQR